uniref:Uncharacterized protein n=1 Tax=Leptospirillum ferriphilum TaxID=178606 RepID=A0A7C3LWI2_9BACT
MAHIPGREKTGELDGRDRKGSAPGTRLFIGTTPGVTGNTGFFSATVQGVGHETFPSSERHPS